MKNFEQLEALVRTLDTDRDKLVVYNILDTIFVSFRGWREWKLRQVNSVWTVVNVRSLYNAVYPQPEYIPVPPPANVCPLCCGGGLDEQSGYSGGNVFRAGSLDVCPRCAGHPMKPAAHVATDREVHDLKLLHEGRVA